MITFLDLLVIVFLELSVTSLLAICLMFLCKKILVKKICFYMVVLLGVFAALINIRMGNSLFPAQTIIGIGIGILCIASFILQHFSKGHEKKFLIARITSAIALLIGIFNAFIF